MRHATIHLLFMAALLAACDTDMMLDTLDTTYDARYVDVRKLPIPVSDVTLWGVSMRDGGLVDRDVEISIVRLNHDGAETVVGPFDDYRTTVSMGVIVWAIRRGGLPYYVDGDAEHYVRVIRSSDHGDVGPLVSASVLTQFDEIPLQVLSAPLVDEDRRKSAGN